MIPGYVDDLSVASTDGKQSDQGSSLSIRFLTENRDNFRQQSQSFKLIFRVRLPSYPLPGTSFAVKGGEILWRFRSQRINYANQPFNR